MEHKPHVALWLVAVFALLGALLSTWIAPKFITWYFDPPAQMGFNCVAPIEWALTRFKWAQTAGIVVGGFVGFSVFITWIRKKKPHVKPVINEHEDL